VSDPLEAHTAHRPIAEIVRRLYDRPAWEKQAIHISDLKNDFLARIARDIVEKSCPSAS
jgi:hypothetical protein